MEDVSLMLTFVAMIAPRLSAAFCLLGLVESTRVSALTDPADVMVLKFIPVPADTDVTVPVPPAVTVQDLSAERS
jgi:hypothetical protein